MQDFIILKGAEVEGVPEIISILPLGHVVSSKGEFDVDEESLQEMKAQIAKRGVDLVVDYEHQTLKGVQAPAAGWVKELKLEDGHIKALVQWTPQAAEYLKNREYRYLSPVVNVRKSDGKVTGLHSLALTNTPAIENMTPIVNSSTYLEGGQSNMEIIKKIAQLLGLGEDASEDQVMEAIGKTLDEVKGLKEAAAGGGAQPPDAEKVVANKAVCELLGLKAGAATDDVTAKIMELKGGTIDGINVVEELKTLKRQNQEREAADAVTLALKAGKITPAQSEWAKSYALSDPKGFQSFVEKAPQVVPMSEIVKGDSLALKSDEVDEATMLVCKQLGITAEDVKKYGKE
ncbi:MAG: phage protease [Acutalibacter sp.]|jgi:phage I-like protein